MGVVNDVAKGLALNGWDTLDGLERALPDDLKAQMKAKATLKAAPYGEVFATAAGQAVLADLIEMTFLRAPAPEELHPASAEQYAISKAKREGQNSIVISILTMIMTARGEFEKGVRK